MFRKACCNGLLLAMMVCPMSETPPPEDHERPINGLVLVVGFVVLVGVGIWLVNALLDARKAQDCLSAGRRNCNPIDLPPRSGEFRVNPAMWALLRHRTG